MDKEKPIHGYRQDGRIIRDLAIRASLCASGVDFQQINNLMVKYWRPETNKSAVKEMERIKAEAEDARNINTFVMKFAINLRELTREHLRVRGHDGDQLQTNLDIIMKTAAEQHTF